MVDVCWYMLISRHCVALIFFRHHQYNQHKMSHRLQIGEYKQKIGFLKYGFDDSLESSYTEYIYFAMCSV